MIERRYLIFILQFAKKKAYVLQNDSGKIPVYCHMTSQDIGGCGEGGWTSVKKIDHKWKQGSWFTLPSVLLHLAFYEVEERFVR